LNIDWVIALIYLILVIAGWFNIYAAVYDDAHKSIFDISMRYGKQLIWIGAAIFIAMLVFIIDSKFYSAFAYIIYGVAIFALLAVLIAGTESHGARSWFEIGDFRLQPSEFAKMATAIVLAQVLSKQGFSFSTLKDFLLSVLIIAIPAGLIILQPDTGSALVYSAFVFVLYREGMNGTWLFIFFGAIALFVLALVANQLIIIVALTVLAIVAYRITQRKGKIAIYALAYAVGLFGVAIGVYYLSDEMIQPKYLAFGASFIVGVTALLFAWRKRMSFMGIFGAILIGMIVYVMSVDIVYNNVLETHQQDRIAELLGIRSDPLGAGYNVNQSKIAIGSGGFLGKGFLNGTQTKYNFVPEQDTDFIFCTVGEEWGFVGSLVVLILFIVLIVRIIFLAERQRSSFSRIYGYGVASIFFFHVAINVGMTLGIAPVIGIPLPFFSYGGSSLWAFTILLFVFLRLDANRLEIFR
jgi:rod shape determining protein RodA